MEATTCHLKNNPHMHDQFEMIPEETKKILLEFTVTSFNNCTWTKERKPLSTSRTHTSWWYKDGSKKNSNINAKCPIWISSNMEKIRMSSMGSTTSLFICSKTMDSYIVGTKQKYWSDWRGWWCTQVKNTSRNTIKIVLGTEFDLMIAQTQIKDWKDSISKRWYYLASTRTKLDFPLRRTKSDRAFIFQLSKLLFKLNQLVQGIQYGFLEKRAIQRTSLLMNLTTRSCKNMAMLLERHPEYHEPPVCL
jgi:hypothetical protein